MERLRGGEASSHGLPIIEIKLKQTKITSSLNTGVFTQMIVFATYLKLKARKFSLAFVPDTFKIE